MRRFIFPIFIIMISSSGCEKFSFDDNSDDPQYVFESFWTELDRNYSFFDYTDLNWDSVYSAYSEKVTVDISDDELTNICADVIDLLKDGHTNIYTPSGIKGNINYFEKYSINQIDDISSYFDYYNSNNKIFDYGKLVSSGIGYIKIKTFTGESDSFEKIDSIISNLGNLTGLIIDVRSNRGGIISNCKTVISRVADSVRTACEYRFRNGNGHNDFSDWIKYSISPCDNNVLKNIPVVVLTNRSSYSATEWFVLSSDVLPNVTIVGDTTGGGSGIPITRELPNGWLLRVSNSQTKLPSGRDYQFTGLYPDIPVWITSLDLLRNKDSILEKAISILST